MVGGSLMDVKAVMAEIGTKLATISGLRVFPFTVDSVPPPGAVVGLPDDITFDETYGRGSDALTLPVWVLVAAIDDRASHAELAAYLAGSGSKSVKAAVDSKRLTNQYASCGTVTVTTATTGAFTSGGVDLLGAEFTVTVTGSGS